MNIFGLEYRGDNESITDYAARVARSHCDLHQKQILENWQMLNSSANVLGIATDSKSKAYVNHPCTVWTRASLENWQFTYDLTEQLALEFMRRNGSSTPHKSWLRVQANIPRDANGLLSGELTPFATAMPPVIVSATGGNPVAAYRQYYNMYKAFFARRSKTKGMFGQDVIVYKVKPATWKNADIPFWWNPVPIDIAIRDGYIKATNEKGKQFKLSMSDNIELVNI